MYADALRLFHCLLLASRMAVAMGSGGVLFTDVAQAEPAHSPELVNVEGRRVEAVIEGAGTPAVVFESGFNGSSPWGPVQSQIAQKTMTLTYQRAGLGRSDPGPNPRSAEQIAKELHALLSATAVRPPYVLVGHSAGGLYVRVFAHMYPKEIAGLVLVDPATEEVFETMRAEKTVEDAKNAGLPPAALAQWIAIQETIDEAHRASPLPRVPTVVLTSTQPVGEYPLQDEQAMQLWLRAHNQLVARTPGSKHIVVENSNHGTILEKPVLPEQILQIVAAVRASARTR
jgi:pimeloyl-ACP methyl ester carboxylesterase